MGEIAWEVEKGVRRANDDGCSSVLGCGCLLVIAAGVALPQLIAAVDRAGPGVQAAVGFPVLAVAIYFVNRWAGDGGADRAVTRSGGWDEVEDSGELLPLDEESPEVWQDSRERELALREREQDLRERELALREREAKLREDE